MAIDSRYKMSQERLDTLKEELHYLETTREKEVAELIKEARSFGDLSENSEYDEAKTEQGKLYSRIAEITDLIENAEVVEKVEVAAARRRPTPWRAAFRTTARSASHSRATRSARPSR